LKIFNSGTGALRAQSRAICNYQFSILNFQFPFVLEPAQTRNTGNVVDSTFTAPNGITI